MQKSTLGEKNRTLESKQTLGTKPKKSSIELRRVEIRSVEF